MDITVIQAGLTSLQTALDITKSVRNSDAELDKATLKFQMAELYSALSDAKMALADAQLLVGSKDAEIVKLIGERSFQETLVQVDGYKFKANSNGNPVGRPYCTRCDQVDNKMVQTMTKGTIVSCPNCKTNYSYAPFFDDGGKQLS